MNNLGRRRRQKVRKRPQKRIPDVYDCPECGNTAIKIEVYKEKQFASVKCGACGLEMIIDEVNPLTEAVDVYGTFIDEYYKERSEEE